MSENVKTAVAFLVVILVAVLSWAGAHDTVARECERLGSFYVGNKTFVCKLKRLEGNP